MYFKTHSQKENLPCSEIRAKFRLIKGLTYCDLFFNSVGADSFFFNENSRPLRNFLFAGNEHALILEANFGISGRFPVSCS